MAGIGTLAGGAWLRAALIGATLALAPVASAAAATTNDFYVNSTADVDNATNQCGTVTITEPAAPGATCTLPEAIDAATAAEQADSTAQNVIAATECGPYYVSTPLPDVPANTVFESDVGQADPGCSDAGAPYTMYGQANDGYWNIVGQAAQPATPGLPGPGADFPGLVFDGAGSGIVGGLIINGFTDGAVLGPPGDDHIYYNTIGGDPYEQGVGNPPDSGDGVLVEDGSAGDVIGSLDADDQPEQNDIDGNEGWGVYLSPGSGPTTVAHNFIGTVTAGDVSGDSDGTDSSYPANSVGCDPVNNPCNGTSGPFGNGLGGVYVGDDNGDVIGGTTVCQNVGDVCDSNLISGNGGPGVEIAPGAGHATVDGNYIGLSLDFYNAPLSPSTYAFQGTGDGLADPNSGAGVLDEGTSDTIGGTQTGAGNLIAGNGGPGVELGGSRASVLDNLIGLDLAGTGAVPNGSASSPAAGILATDAAGVTHGFNSIRGNVIGGNTGPGIQLDQASNTVLSNAIGTQGDEQSPLPNAIGILAERGPESIGGTTGGANTIAYNNGAGVAIVNPPSSSSYTSGVSLFDNSIFSNGGLGIDLGDDGPTANHPLDSTPGPDGWQNFPTLATASSAGNQYVVHGSISAAPNTYYTVLLFGNSACDSNGRGEGQTLVNDGAVTTDANGDANFALTGSGLAVGTVLSATAVSDLGNTSEFSPCLTVGGGVDLKVTQAVSGGGQVIADEPVDVDIHVVNSGSGNATNVLLKDSVPSGETIVSQPAGCPAPTNGTFTCDIGSLASGASEDVQVLLEPADVTTLTNAVSLSSDEIQTVSSDATSNFATAVSANPSAPPSSPYSIDEQNPTVGQYLELRRIAGTVTATLPNKQVIHLEDFALVPVGTTVQTTNGIAQVTAALARAGQTSTASFKYGEFILGQEEADNGLVTATLDGSLSGCPANKAKTKAKAKAKTKATKRNLPEAVAASARKAKTTKKSKGPRKRRLWGHDSGGNFRIKGNLGAATVEGTTWQVTDTCTTTKVVVFEGKVDVTAIKGVTPAHATVTAGHYVTLKRP